MQSTLSKFLCIRDAEGFQNVDKELVAKIKMLKPTSLRDIINQAKMGMKLCDIQRESCIAYVHGCSSTSKLNLARAIESFQKLFILSRVLGDPEGERTALMRLAVSTYMNR